MPSSDPFDTTIETFSIVFGTSSTRGASSSCVISSTSSLDAAVRLRDAADLRGELRRTLREQLVQLLDRNARLLAERPDRRSGAGVQVALAHEANDQPVARRQLGDAVLAGDLLCERLIPLLRVDEKAVRVDRGCDRRHGSSFREPAAAVRAAARASRTILNRACRGGSAATRRAAAAARGGPAAARRRSRSRSAAPSGSPTR